MAHFCGFIKLIFLLLMLARIPRNETRPLKGNSQANSDLIAGNEFLKLFMEHDQLDKDSNSREFNGGGSGGHKGNTAAVANRKKAAAAANRDESFDKKSAETGRRFSNGRSLIGKGPRLNQAEGHMEDRKQVVKLVTSGSKIVFLEDYDENDAILDAEARDIDLKKETVKQKNQTNLDDYKVVAVSVSSSSQRGTTTTRNRFANTAPSSKYERRAPTISSTTSKAFVTMTPKPSTATSARSKATSSTSPTTHVENTAADNFINRSHKSEFSIEEVEPLTMTQHQARNMHSRHRKHPLTSVSDTLEALDSENSASTNIHNVLAAPLQPSASARSTSMVTTTYHSGQRNMTINHDSTLSRHKTATAATADDEQPNAGKMQQQQHNMPSDTADGGVVEDQLLPFQTVIYHDTKIGHGPQSRSISYSSISQNVEDLKKWQQTGILAEARRNVSESLKPMPRVNASSSNQQPEPTQFFSQPSKMYSEPSKFYSEPAKVYSEPAKVYGEPEKFYSEPAKVYGQPSKFYSEPAKVYSQPAKVYSEPAKTYWPILTGTTTSTQSSNTQQLLELQKTKRPQQTLTYQQQQQQQQEQPKPQQQQQQQQQQRQRHNINPCLESAVSSLFSSSTLSAHPALQKQQQQHSNQNAKGLPNGDLVKCVATISHTSDVDSDDEGGGVEAYTTERSHTEELFTPTPEQNYEIEEAVSVTTNGRGHAGVRNSFGQPTTSPAHQLQHHGFKPNRQRTRIHFGTNVNNPADAHAGGHISQTTYNTNANANTDANSNHKHHNAPDYQQYDDENEDDNVDGDNDDDDGTSPVNGNNGDGNDEDAKVAYIVEGQNYRKYRVEEETDDGFIVGEYGVVDHNDGNLRGVRYTADSTINRSLIQKALLTFLKLK